MDRDTMSCRQFPNHTTGAECCAHTRGKQAGLSAKPAELPQPKHSLNTRITPQNPDICQQPIRTCLCPVPPALQVVAKEDAEPPSSISTRAAHDAENLT